MRSGRLHMQNSQDSILQSEMEFLCLKGPSLNMFSQSGDRAQGSSWQPKSVKDHEGMVKLPQDSNSNIRALYYCVLNLLFGGEQTELCRHTLQKLKSVVYLPAVRLDWFKPKEIDPVYRQFYDNRLFKKLFVEFLRVLEFKRGMDSVANLLSDYPIMDLVLILVVRAVYIHYSRTTNNHSMREIIPTEQLIECFEEALDILIPTELTPGSLFTLAGISLYDCGPYCLLVEERARGSFEASRPQRPSTCESIDLSEVGSSVTEFSEVLCDDWNPEVRGNPSSELKQLNALYLSKFRKQRDQNGDGRSSQTASSSIMPEGQHFLTVPRPFGKHQMTYSQNQKKCSQVYPQTMRKSLNTQPQKKNKIEQIYDGLTSPQVMNLLKPEIKREMDEKRKQSILKVMKCKNDYNTNTKQTDGRGRLKSDMMPHRRTNSGLTDPDKNVEKYQNIMVSSCDNTARLLSQIDPADTRNVVKLPEPTNKQRNLNNLKVTISVSNKNAEQRNRNYADTSPLLYQSHSPLLQQSNSPLLGQSTSPLLPLYKLNSTSISSPPLLSFQCQPGYQRLNSSQQPTSKMYQTVSNVQIPMSNRVVIHPTSKLY